MIDEQRAAWFRQHARFERCRIAHERDIWTSWTTFGGAGTRAGMRRWLLAIGLARHPSHSALYIGMKLI